MERELGRGAMAVVYLARQRDLDSPVALKELAGLLAADGGLLLTLFCASQNPWPWELVKTNALGEVVVRQIVLA